MELGEKWPINLACDSDFHVNRRVLLHAANLQNGRHAVDISPVKSDGFGLVRTRDLGYQKPAC
jgi:hypothetical protein